MLPSERNAHLYSAGDFHARLKKLAETKDGGVGIMTQCVKPEGFYTTGRPPREKDPKLFDQKTLENLLAKINAKPGGINFIPAPDKYSQQVDLIKYS